LQDRRQAHPSLPAHIHSTVPWTSRGVLLPASLPELTQEGTQGWVLHDVYLVHGSFPIYHSGTRTLTNLVAFRGFKDCGFFYVYSLEQERFVLDEARYQEECNDTTFISSDRWEIIYSRPSTAVSPTMTPFPLDTSLESWWAG
jgi:hypothetical protein